MINIYLDTTGSMMEMGKDSALIYIAKSIEDYCSFKDINTTFFTSAKSNEILMFS